MVQYVYVAKKPSPNGKALNGRTDQGKFALGWKGGPGNPFAARVSALKVAMYEAIDNGDIQAMTKRLVNMAKRGNVVAAKVIMDRLLGPAVDPATVSITHNGQSIHIHFDVDGGESVPVKEVEYREHHNGHNGHNGSSNGNGHSPPLPPPAEAS